MFEPIVNSGNIVKQNNFISLDKAVDLYNYLQSIKGYIKANYYDCYECIAENVKDSKKVHKDTMLILESILSKL